MQWNLEQLRVFVQVADSGSFSAAARHLRRAQSAVSASVAGLEADLGLTLFARNGGRQPRLTGDGVGLLAEAREVLRQCERLQSRALALARHEPGRLSVLMDEAIPLMPITASLEALAQAYPNVEVSLRSGFQSDIGLGVEQGRSDIGLLFRGDEVPDALERRFLGEAQMVCIVARDHPLHASHRADRRALAAYRQFLVAPRRNQYLSRSQVSPQVWHVDSFYMMAELVMRGLGWAQVPRHVADYPAYRPLLRILPTVEPAPRLPIELVWRRDRPLGAMGVWLGDTLEGQLRER